MALLPSLLVFILVAGIVYWAASSLIAAFGIPNPLSTVILVVIVLILLFSFLNMTGILASPVFPTLRRF